MNFLERWPRWSACLLALLFAAPASAVSIDINTGSVPGSGGFVPGVGGDVFSIDAADFGVTDPLVFQSGIFGNPALSRENLAQSGDDPTAIGTDANVIVIQNFDNNEFDGQVPSTWDASWNARTSLQAIARNTEGDRSGFFLYWNEGLGVNRLFATDNLNDENGSLQLLFTVQSATLTGVPGAFDLDLSDGQAQTNLFGEANANLFSLNDYTADNFEFANQLTPVPVPAALPMLLAALGGLAAVSCRRRRMT